MRREPPPVLEALEDGAREDVGVVAFRRILKEVAAAARNGGQVGKGLEKPPGMDSARVSGRHDPLFCLSKIQAAVISPLPVCRAAVRAGRDG